MTSRTGKSDSARPAAAARSAAFTLIEVLVALVVLSTGIVLVLRAFSTSLGALGEARDALTCTALARERVAELELAALQGRALRELSGRGGFEPPHEDFQWQVDVEQVEVPGLQGEGGPPSGALNRIEVAVGPVEGGRLYRLSTCLWEPGEDPAP